MHGYVTDLVVTFRYLERRGRRAPPGAEVPDETEASSEEEVEVRRGRRVSKTGERRRERR